MVFHLQTAGMVGEVVLRTNDSDVAIILLGSNQNFDPNLVVWMEMGLYTKNTLRYINITKLYEKLGGTLCKALPGFHALTGSDSTPVASGRGKLGPYKKLEKNKKVQKALGNLGETETVNEKAVNEHFHCIVYGYHPKLTSIDVVRLEIFLKKYKQKKGDTQTFAKKLQSNFFPPCRKVLLEQIKRANLIAANYKSVTNA